MEAKSFFRIAIYWMMIIIICQGSVVAQTQTCTLPHNKPGICVAIERCRNIYNLVKSPTTQSQKYRNYIEKAACTIPGVTRSICCQSVEVVRELSTTPHSRVCPPVPTVSKKDLLPRECGVTVTDKLSYGSATKVFAYPWMAVLQYAQNGAIIDGCAGSLINKRYILTAAHCLKTKSGIRLHSVILGEHTKNQKVDCNIHDDGHNIERDCANPIEEFGIESFKIHEDYNRPRFSNDIGLIRLDRDVTMQDHIQPICLPVTEQLQTQVHKSYILTGWGTTESGLASNILMEAELRHVNNAVCRQKMMQHRLNIELSDKQMCAGGKDLVDACKGDSGGPLGTHASLNNVRFVQFGIVTSGLDVCGKKNIPGVYCRVASYMEWILDQIEPSC